MKMKNDHGFLSGLPLLAAVGVGIVFVGAIFFIGKSVHFLAANVLVAVSDTELESVRIDPKKVDLTAGQKQEFQAFGVFPTGEVALRVEWASDPEGLGELECSKWADKCSFTAGNGEEEEGNVTIKWGDLEDDAEVKVAKGAAISFPDVPAGEWFYDAVMQAVNLNLMKGREDGYFYPQEAAVRADYVLVNYRLLGALGVDLPDEFDRADCNTFVDVPADHYAAQAICAFSGMGWIKGLSESDKGKVFGPDELLTREQASKILYLSLEEKWEEVDGEEISDFTDVPKGRWSYPYVMGLAERGIFKGKEAGVFAPEDGLNRAQTATIVTRSYGKL